MERKDVWKKFKDFKTFMIVEHEQLEEVGALNVKHSDLNHANIIQSINEKHEELLQKLEDRSKVKFIEALATYGNMEQCPGSVPAYDSSLSSGPFEPIVSNVSADPIMAQLLQGFNELKQKVDNISTQGLNHRAYSSLSGSRKGMQKINPKTGKAYKRYCWSCGCCTHWEKFCPNKKRGHKDEATFKERMNGSSDGCLGS